MYIEATFDPRSAPGTADFCTELSLKSMLDGSNR